MAVAGAACVVAEAAACAVAEAAACVGAGSEAACAVAAVACVVAEAAVGMAAGEATGNRICGGKQFLSKKTGMEVSRMMRIKDSFQKVRWWTVVIRLTPVALFLLWTFGFITWVLLA